MKKLVQEFRDFITRGNAIDLAIGIIIGSAFSAVVNSIVNNLLMPPFGLILGNVDFQDLFIVLRQGEQVLPPSATLEMAKEVGAVTFNYGQFITDLISFLLLGLGVFLIVRGINKLNALKAKMIDEEKATAEETEKDCPYCHKPIPIQASRCPFCTSQLGENQEAAVG
ncbi:MAG: large conductance mechanosensitive channel protein MscL [Brevefilum sp.]